MSVLFYRAVRYNNGYLLGIVATAAASMAEGRAEIEATLTRDKHNCWRLEGYQRWVETGKIIMVSRDGEGLDVVEVVDEYGNRFEKQGYKWFEVMQLPVGAIVQPVQQQQAQHHGGKEVQGGEVTLEAAYQAAEATEPPCPQAMGQREMEVLLASWKGMYQERVASGVGSDEWGQGVCVGILNCLGYTNSVDIVYHWREEALYPDPDPDADPDPDPDPPRAVCYSAQDVGAEVSFSELPDCLQEAMLDQALANLVGSGVVEVNMVGGEAHYRLPKKEGWPVNGNGQPYADMTLDLAEIPF